jgi:phage gp36-like protein
VSLTDDAGSGAVDTSVVDRAIADAGEEIDGYVGSRYPVPLAPVPGIIRKYAVDVAIYNLYSRRPMGAPEHRKARYDAAIKFLMAVGRGDLSLGVNDPGGNPPEAKGPEMASTNPPKIFGRDKTRGY